MSLSLLLWQHQQQLSSPRFHLRGALLQQQQQQQQQQQLMSLALLLWLQLVAHSAVMRVYDCEDNHYLFVPIHEHY